MHLSMLFTMLCLALGVSAKHHHKHHHHHKPPKYEPKVIAFDTHHETPIELIVADIHGKPNNISSSSPKINSEDYGWESRMVCVSDACGFFNIDQTQHQHGPANQSIVEDRGVVSLNSSAIYNASTSVTECVDRTFRCVDRRLFAIAVGELKQEAGCQSRKCFERQRTSLSQLTEFLGWFDL